MLSRCINNQSVINQGCVSGERLGYDILDALWSVGDPSVKNGIVGGSGATAMGSSLRLTSCPMDSLRLTSPELTAQRLSSDGSSPNLNMDTLLAESALAVQLSVTA